MKPASIRAGSALTLALMLGAPSISRAALAARGETPAAFGRRCIPSGCVTPRSNTPGIFTRRALPAGRITGLGATPDFRHGLLDKADKAKKADKANGDKADKPGKADRADNDKAGKIEKVDSAAKDAGEASATAAPQAGEPDDAALKLAEPDYTLVALPTSLRLAKYKSAFRVTHRFTRPLNDGGFGSLAEDLFGLDSGAVIGLEYRFGIVPGGQIGIHRTSDRTIEFFGQYGLIRQGESRPVDVSILATVDGTNNFRDSYSPALGAIISRTIGDRAALYVEPIWVNNTNPLPKQVSDDNDTVMIGLGARVRISPTVYLAGEVAPRVSGFKPGRTHGSFAIEKRAGGHMFQLNFSNAFGTTMGQVARGGPSSDRTDWYMGFNISRKFF